MFVKYDPKRCRFTTTNEYYTIDVNSFLFPKKLLSFVTFTTTIQVIVKSSYKEKKKK